MKSCPSKSRSHHIPICCNLYNIYWAHKDNFNFVFQTLQLKTLSLSHLESSQKYMEVSSWSCITRSGWTYAMAFNGPGSKKEIFMSNVNIYHPFPEIWRKYVNEVKEKVSTIPVLVVEDDHLLREWSINNTARNDQDWHHIGLPSWLAITNNVKRHWLQTVIYDVRQHCRGE